MIVLKGTILSIEHGGEGNHGRPLKSGACLSASNNKYLDCLQFFIYDKKDCPLSQINPF